MKLDSKCLTAAFWQQIISILKIIAIHFELDVQSNQTSFEDVMDIRLYAKCNEEKNKFCALN